MVVAGCAGSPPSFILALSMVSCGCKIVSQDCRCRVVSRDLTSLTNHPSARAESAARSGRRSRPSRAMGLFGGRRKSTNATSTAPPEETGSQFTSDQMIRVVTLTARKDEAKSVRLADVVKDPRWAEAVARSPWRTITSPRCASPRPETPPRRAASPRRFLPPRRARARFLTLGRARASWSFARRAREFPGPLGRDVSPLRSPARRASIPPLRRTYDEFVSHAKARTLSYRFGTPLELDCRNARIPRASSRGSRRAPPDSPGHTPGRLDAPVGGRLLPPRRPRGRLQRARHQRTAVPARPRASSVLARRRRPRGVQGDDARVDPSGARVRPTRQRRARAFLPHLRHVVRRANVRAGVRR